MGGGGSVGGCPGGGGCPGTPGCPTSASLVALAPFTDAAEACVPLLMTAPPSIRKSASTSTIPRTTILRRMISLPIMSNQAPFFTGEIPPSSFAAAQSIPAGERAEAGASQGYAKVGEEACSPAWGGDSYRRLPGGQPVAGCSRISVSRSRHTGAAGAAWKAAVPVPSHSPSRGVHPSTFASPWGASEMQ
jgi:hypothetical protein